MVGGCGGEGARENWFRFYLWAPLLCVPPSCEVLGPSACQEERRETEKLLCLQGGASQDRLFHYALHIHLATDEGSNSFNSFSGENYFKLCSTPVCQAHPRYELRSDSNVHTQGHIPPVALRNLRKWLAMYYMKLKLNLEVKRQSTKPQH